MNKYYTENIADFGYREIKMLREILDSWLNNGLPENFNDNKVKPAMNKCSGYVFLTNEDYQCCMINHDTNTLELWHNLPYSGAEGFLMDLFQENDPETLNNEDKEYLLSHTSNETFIYEELSRAWQKLVD